MTLRGDILKNIVAVVLALTIALPIGFSSGLTAFADESSSEETSVSEESSQEESSDVSDASSSEASSESSTESSTAATNYTIPSASSDFYVYDEMNTISDATRQSIVQTGEYLNTQYGAQIVVAVFNTLGDYNIESFTNELLTSWKVGGDAGYGLVFLMDVSEDDYYCISGEGLKQLYTSSKIQTILDDNIESVFAQKNYDAAALAFVNACTSDLEKYMQDLAASGVVLVKNSNTTTTTASAGDSTDAQSADTQSTAQETTKKSGGFLGFLKVLVIIILVLIILLCILFVLAYLHGQKVKRERAEARRRNAQRRGNSSSAPRSSQRSSSSSRGNTLSSRQRSSGGTRSGTTVNRARSSSSQRSDYRSRYDR